MSRKKNTIAAPSFEEELELFHSGASQNAYSAFGCHYIKERAEHRFALWAPNAQWVSVIGDFNGWDEHANVMDRLSSGDFVCYIPELESGAVYKYAVCDRHGNVIHKADPFAFHSETGPKTGSKIWDTNGFDWGDSDFLRKKAKRDIRRSAMSVYEVHIGSWKRGEDEIFPWYRKVADELSEYCAKLGYTHVELMPITEYPFEGSWGYQVTGYFSPSSRYGTPQDFMYFVDTLHKNGIGVIMDWVPAHFPKDAHGLAYFDGTAQYERLNPKMASHPQWGTLIFDYAKPEVQSFLISSACFFAEAYHIDGLRVDAVSSMLYLDYCREDGFEPNEQGGNLDFGAVHTLREMTTALKARNCITIAEESSAHPGVTAAVEHGGLGFTFKWDMGFMHDTLDYFELDPYFRKYHHDKLTFSMMYAFNEHFVLAFSHDEVVHGKKSMVNKMFGDYEQKFASLRTLYGYQYAHTGKKHTFMGSEFAQFIEWDYERELDWFLLKYPIHDSMLAYSQELNKLYRSYPSLYRIDDSWEGFEWLNVEDNERSCLAFMRKAPKTRAIVCLCNFTPVENKDFVIGINKAGTLRLVLNSDEARFGGYGAAVAEEVTIVKNGFYGYSHSATLSLPAMSCLYYELIPSRKTR